MITKNPARGGLTDHALSRFGVGYIPRAETVEPEKDDLDDEADPHELDLKGEKPEPRGQDISRSANGFSQMNKDAFSALKAGTTAKLDPTIQAKLAADKKKAEEEARQRIIAAKIAAWDDEKIVVGGIEMKRGEVRKIVSKMSKDPDTYANRAVEQGLIKEDQKDSFKQYISDYQENLKEQERLIREGKENSPEMKQAREKERQMNQSPSARVMVDSRLQRDDLALIASGAEPKASVTSIAKSEVPYASQTLSAEKAFNAEARPSLVAKDSQEPAPQTSVPDIAKRNEALNKFS